MNELETLKKAIALDLSIVEAVTMSVLAISGPCQAREIRKHTKQSPTSFSNMIRAMQARRLVHWKHKINFSWPKYELTPLGMKQWKQYQPATV